MSTTKERALQWHLVCPLCDWHGWVDAERAEEARWDARQLCPKCNADETEEGRK